MKIFLRFYWLVFCTSIIQQLLCFLCCIVGKTAVHLNAVKKPRRSCVSDAFWPTGNTGLGERWRLVRHQGSCTVVTWWCRVCGQKLNLLWSVLVEQTAASCFVFSLRIEVKGTFTACREIHSLHLNHHQYEEQPVCSAWGPVPSLGQGHWREN